MRLRRFYFRASGLPRGTACKLNVVNLCKRDSLYNRGLRPLVYSEGRARTEGVGWVRGCERVAYFPSLIHQRQLPTGGGGGGAAFRTLTFTYTPGWAAGAAAFVTPFRFVGNNIQNLDKHLA